MKKGILILVLLLSLQVFLSGIPINPVVVAGNWHVVYINPYSNQPANDFHICGIIESLDNYQPKLQNHAEFVVGGGVPWYLEEFTIEKVANHPKNWYFTAHFKTNGLIPPGTMMHFGLYFLTNYCNKAVINCAYWTYFKEAVGRMPLISFHIYRNGNNVINLINTAEIPLILVDVELMISPRPIPLEDMFTSGLGNPGERAPVNADGTVDKDSINQYADLEWNKIDKELAIKPGAAFKFDLQEVTGRDLEPGNFLILRGYTIYENIRVPWWIQHEEGLE